MKKYARKLCPFLQSFWFEVTWAFGKMCTYNRQRGYVTYLNLGPHFTFRTLEEITDYFPTIANSSGILHPNNVTASIKTLSNTYEGREIQMIRMALEVRFQFFLFWTISDTFII